MSHWPFILAAYGLTAAGTLALVAASWAAMRRAERLAERIGRDT
jgi:hypothetical protein